MAVTYQTEGIKMPEIKETRDYGMDQSRSCFLWKKTR